MAKKKNSEPIVEETNVETLIDEQGPAPKEESATLCMRGIVSGCSKLNIRKKPNIKSDPIAVVNAKTNLEVHVHDSTKDWYKVTTLDGGDGFCMKKYITIEQ